MKANWSFQVQKTNGSSKNGKDMKARTSEINIRAGNLQEGFTAAADAPS